MKKLLIFSIIFLYNGILFGQSKKEYKASIILYQDTISNLQSSIYYLERDIKDEKEKIRLLKNDYQVLENDYKKKDIQANKLNTEVISLNNSLANLYINRDTLISILDSAINQMSIYNNYIDSLNTIVLSLSLEKTSDEVLEESNDFLTNLYLKETEIESQDFDLIFKGIVCRGNGSFLDVYDGYGYRYDLKGLEDIRTYLLSNLSVYIRDSTLISYISNNPSQFFPNFSFLKGKLLTIENKVNKIKKDYLFSYSFSQSSFDESRMVFKLIDGSENSFIIPTIIINNQIYIIMSQDLIAELNFDIEFSDFATYNPPSSFEKTYMRIERKSGDRFSSSKITLSSNTSNLWDRNSHEVTNTFYLFKLKEK